MFLSPTERLEVCKLCPSFLLGRGVLWSCWIPHTRSNIHGNTGHGGLRVYGLEHGRPPGPWRHNNARELLSVFWIFGSPKNIPKWSQSQRKIKKRQIIWWDSFKTSRKQPVSWVMDNQLENPSSDKYQCYPQERSLNKVQWHCGCLQSFSQRFSAEL